MALRLRHFAELDARIQRGEIISSEEMAGRYYPTRETWAVAAAWAASQGLTVQAEDVTHMTVFTHGPVSQLARAFQTRFARVQGGDGQEYTSAVSSPSVPSEIAASVAAVRQLQPHLGMKPMTVYNPISTANAYAPRYLLDHYNASGVGDGAGQIVAIYGFQNPPNSDDLMTYWAAIGSPHTMADVTIINPLNFPAYDHATGNGAGIETTMDVEIVSGLCPGAKLRVYCVPDLGTVATMVLADLKQYPGLHQLSISGVMFGGESRANAIDSQYYAALSAQGVTVFAGSGDGGSNPDWATGGRTYNDASPLVVAYPASDPYVTGVGGTQQDLNFVAASVPYLPITGVKAEVAWTEGTNPVWVINGSFPAAGGGSGGGFSTVFARPAWQTGGGLPAGSMRCVPDVAAEAQGGLFTYIGGPGQAAGTSESTPIWAAMCAIINQSLQAKGQAPIGLLNAKIYPLAGTSALRYVTRGWITHKDAGIVFANSAPVPAGAVDTNGAYNVGPAYDLITGLGVPDVAQLAAALTLPGSGGPTITLQPQSQSVSTGAGVRLHAGATGGALSYQWSHNGSILAGATNAILAFDSIGTDQRGTYTCAVTNALGSVVTAPATLTVTSSAQLVNLSARVNVGTGANVLIAGLVVAGDAASTPKNILVRAMGPSLELLGVSGFLAKPILAFHDASGEIATNSGWSQPVQPIAKSGVVFQPASPMIMGAVGAFGPASSTSSDAALVAAVPVGAGRSSYTAQISGANDTGGVALVEVYDADSSVGNAGNTARLVNLSARANVGLGANVLIAGFVVSGESAETILIRGMGPTLGTIGVPGSLVNTVITVYDSNQLPIASNSGWSTAPTHGTSPINAGIEQATAATFSSVGAFQPSSAASADSAMVITLPAGAYTIQVAGPGDSTGVALFELYEIR